MKGKYFRKSSIIKNMLNIFQEGFLEISDFFMESAKKLAKILQTISTYSDNRGKLWFFLSLKISSRDTLPLCG